MIEVSRNFTSPNVEAGDIIIVYDFDSEEYLYRYIAYDKGEFIAIELENGIVTRTEDSLQELVKKYSQGDFRIVEVIKKARLQVEESVKL